MPPNILSGARCILQDDYLAGLRNGCPSSVVPERSLASNASASLPRNRGAMRMPPILSPGVRGGPNRHPPFPALHYPVRMRIFPILAALVISALSLSALKPAPQMTVQNQDWTAYFSTNGRVLTVDYTRPADPNLYREWHTAYEIPASSNASFEVTDILDLTVSRSGGVGGLIEIFSERYDWSARILRSTGEITPVAARRKRTHEWNRTGFIMQPGDRLQISSLWDGVMGSSELQYRWIINGNVTR